MGKRRIVFRTFDVEVNYLYINNVILVSLCFEVEYIRIYCYMNISMGNKLYVMNIITCI